MQLKSLTYTSLARLDLRDEDVNAIHRTARDLNALDGVSGLLVFNGTRFLQIIEGSENAIDDLLVRLRRDPRHSGLEVRDERMIEARSFPSWRMELVRVKSDYIEASESVLAKLPDTVPAEIRERIVLLTEAISGTIDLTD